MNKIYRKNQPIWDQFSELKEILESKFKVVPMNQKIKQEIYEETTKVVKEVVGKRVEKVQNPDYSIKMKEKEALLQQISPLTLSLKKLKENKGFLGKLKGSNKLTLEKLEAEITSLYRELGAVELQMKFTPKEIEKEVGGELKEITKTVRVPKTIYKENPSYYRIRTEIEESINEYLNNLRWDSKLWQKKYKEIQSSIDKIVTVSNLPEEEED